MQVVFELALPRHQGGHLCGHGILGEDDGLRDRTARSVHSWTRIKVGGGDADAAKAVAVSAAAIAQELQLAPKHVGLVHATMTRRRCLHVAACRVTMESNISGISATTQEFLKFFTEVIIEPSIEQRIGAGRAHADHVAYGIGHQHSLRHGRRMLHVRVQIKEIQGQPRHPEDNSNAYQQPIGALHPSATLHFALRRALHSDHGNAALQLVIDAEVGHRYNQYGHQILYA